MATNIQLEKYTGRASRHKCPKCGDNFSFAYYLDERNQIINEKVGRCNHESNCGYHYTPKQFFIDNPTEKERKAFVPFVKTNAVDYNAVKKTDFIPFNYVAASSSYKSDFVYFLCSLFDRYTLASPTIERIMNDYALGATKEGDVIFWQIDLKGKVRTGKVIKYNRKTGKRVKDAGGINWVHSLMKKQGKLKEDFNLNQCLFGEHLLKIYPDRTVALVEAEKTALIAYGCYPDYIWLATGGKSQLSIDKLKVLKGRTVIMFPDVDGFDMWKEKAKEIESAGVTVMVSDLLEKNATPEERNNKIDLADWLVVQLRSETDSNLSPAERVLREMERSNPALTSLIDKFNLQLVN